ncbi:Ninja-family protein AFP1 [Forsythia ovata]|uniref:Ninja-family protein n=1 Tax=Forsythia ovata TaxID=205694 RepID=A0ABD1WD48_9LAMI
MDTLCLDISTNRFSRDLLQRFMGSSSGNEAVKEEDEEIELNLGLSLGGRFGVDKSSKKLGRSSSVAECLPVVRDDSDAMAPPSVAYTGLLRTSSLPAETEEEWRKRKQLQTLRRMEAKRRRSEKQRNLKGDKEGGGSRGGGGNLSLEEKKEIEVNLRERLEREKSLAATKRSGLPFRLSTWDATATDQSIRGGINEAVAQGKGNYLGGSGGMQKSMESKGGSSSSMSELESKTFGVSSSGGELSPGSIQSVREGINQDGGSSGVVRNRGKEIGTNTVEDMPCVFTKGDGPNGRRVDGILYKYGKGEEVRIMCVCHGTFLSPAQFVEHAGGSDVDHPLKHIVVNPNSSSLS